MEDSATAGNPAAFLLRRENAYFLALIAFGVVYSFGIEGGLMPVLAHWIPGWTSFRVPARGLFLVVIGMAGLAALLVTQLQRATVEARAALLRPVLRVWLPISSAVLFALAIFFSGWYAASSHVEPMPLRAYQVAGALALAGTFALGAWAALWLWTQPDAALGRWALALTAVFVVIDAWHGGLPNIRVGEGTRRRCGPARAEYSTGRRTRAGAPPWGGPENSASATGITTSSATTRCGWRRRQTRWPEHSNDLTASQTR